MMVEALNQMPTKPTHVFLQAGVGSMAGSSVVLVFNTEGELEDES